ncbi:TolB family protein [Paenibacillus methanolicus]|uniref:TolB protein n=1 Tax=Paenibacillus methanolicus TaxID=582686 RepID=A0A5S5BT55_9BACL|nr:PD40 domain-containing protein [Paenibacillus methanolicus]TYP70197.1 TolB protein [Paenibacillus methanolicus]
MQQFELQLQNGYGLIAFTSNRGGAFAIWLYRPSDGWCAPLTRGLAVSASIPYWSPNKRKLAFIGEQSRVYVVDALTGAVLALNRIESHTFLDWSPSSRIVGFAVPEGITLYDTVSHQAAAIHHPGAYDLNWFPSGRELLFAAPDADGNGQLYRVRTDGGGLRQLTDQKEGPIHHVRLSPDGSRVLYTYPGASISLIATLELATGAVHRLEGGPLSKNVSPVWSPDSRSVAYSATVWENERYSAQIETDLAQGGRRQTIATASCYASVVSWSPDGNLIAYTSGCREPGDEATQMWVADADQRRAPLQIVDGTAITSLQWSPS